MRRRLLRCPGLFLLTDKALAACPRPAGEYFKPMQLHVSHAGYSPEPENAVTGEAYNQGPTGFSATPLPFLSSPGNTASAETHHQQIKNEPLAIDAYYRHAPALFGQGWSEERFRFNDRGDLQLPSPTVCPH